MKRKLIFGFATVLVLVILQTSSFKLQSHIVRPLEGGLANDPNQTNCAHCHSTLGAPTVRNSQFIIRISLTQAGLANDSSIVTPSHNYYTPNHTQWISLDLTGVNTNAAPAIPYYGFQFTALLANDSMAGSFDTLNLTDPKTSYETSNSAYNPALNGYITYIGHANADTTHIWYFEWTAPDSSAGPVTFYYSGNLGNGYDVTQQPAPPLPYPDTIFVGSVTLYPGPSSTLGINSPTGSINSVSVYPVPFGQQLNADLDLNSSSDVSLTILSLEGQAIRELYNGRVAQGHFSRSFDIADLATGVYLVRVQSGTDTKVVKVLKY